MTTTTVRETERKYDAQEQTQLPALDDLPGVSATVGPDEQTLEAVYYDTDDLRLARSGVTLRRRSGGDDAGWHLKLPPGGGDKDSRDELRLPDTGDSQPPPELVELTTSQTRGRELAPVALLTTRRRRHQLIGDDQRPVAEVVDDAVSGHTLGAETTAQSWREFEVELTGGGSPELLDAVETRLRDASIRRADSPSKLARLLGDRLRSYRRSPREHDSSSAGGVVLGYLGKWVEELTRRDPQVRQDSPDAVHPMRTALRRLRSILQVYGRIVDREQTRQLTDELKWLAGVLAPARDLEVLRTRLDSMIEKLPPEDVVGPVSARLTRHFARQEAAARAKICAVLEGQRYLELLDRLDDLLDHPPLTRRAERPADKELPRQLRRAYRRFERRMRHADRTLAGAERDDALHEVRKTAKRLRYGIDAARPALSGVADGFRKRLKKVQELLGDHQEAVVARPPLRELSMQAHLDGENGYTYGLLHGAQGAVIDKTQRELPRAHRRLTRGKLRRWMR